MIHSSPVYLRKKMEQKVVDFEGTITSPPPAPYLLADSLSEGTFMTIT
jgi:hypothetical protein